MKRTFLILIALSLTVPLYSNEALKAELCKPVENQWRSALKSLKYNKIMSVHTFVMGIPRRIPPCYNQETYYAYSS